MSENLKTAVRTVGFRNISIPTAAASTTLHPHQGQRQLSTGGVQQLLLQDPPAAAPSIINPLAVERKEVSPMFRE